KEARARLRRISRRQFVSEPQMHGRESRRASVWRIQHVRHGLQGRRPGLFAPVPASQSRGRKPKRKMTVTRSLNKKPWLKYWGKLRYLRQETKRINRIIERHTEEIDKAMWR